MSRSALRIEPDPVRRTRSRGFGTARPSTSRVRILTPDDIPAAVALFGRVYPETRRGPLAACESYFREMLFDNPWTDLQIPSWIAEDAGRILGFYAVLPRRMLLDGRPLRVAVPCQFVVDPDSRDTLAMLQLAQACLSGPQDLTLADGANDRSRRLWTAIGGTVPVLYSLHWTRLLRPAGYALSLLRERAMLPSAFARAAQALAKVPDAMAGRVRQNRFLWEETELVEDALDGDTMLAHLPHILRGRALQPVYDARTLAWLLAQSAAKSRHGKLRARVVRDRAGTVLGWYLYYLQPGAVSEVAQLAARENAYDVVLQRLMADAWRHGAAALHGRLDPRYFHELAARHCWFGPAGIWTLVHSRHADVLAAIHRGEAFLSRLEGEWCLRFLDRG
jgi:hypothetical protein